MCRRRSAGQFWSAAARRWSKKWARGKNRRWRRRGAARSGRSKNFILSSKFSEDFFSHRDKMQQNKLNTSMAWAARRLSAAARLSPKICGAVSGL